MAGRHHDLRELEVVDFLTPGHTQRRLLRLSYAIFTVLAIVGLGLYLAGWFSFPAELTRLQGMTGLSLPLCLSLWFALMLAASMAVLPVHELVHAACFRLFGGPGTMVRFGAASGMLYAACPGLVLAKGRFAVVLAAPAVVLSIAMLLAGGASGLSLLGYVVFALHLTGCSGDLVGIVALARNASCSHCEDTATGLRLLG